MAEQTEVGTVAALYEERISDLKRSHAEAASLLERRYDQLLGQSKDNEAELKAQADGLLGALGRVNGENQELKAECARLKQDMAGRHLEMQMRFLEEARQMENERLKTKARIAELEKALAEARGEKK